MCRNAHCFYHTEILREMVLRKVTKVQSNKGSKDQRIKVTKVMHFEPLLL